MSFTTLKVQVQSDLLYLSKLNQNWLVPSWARLTRNLIPPSLALLFLWLIQGFTQSTKVVDLMAMSQQRKASTSMSAIVFHCHNVSLLNTGLLPSGTAGLLQSKAFLTPSSSLCCCGPSKVSQIAALSDQCFQVYTLVFSLKIFLKIFYLFIFREKEREREREGEKHQCAVASHMSPTGGPGPQPRHAP